MNKHGLTKANLMATLPVALQKDPSAVALAEAMAELLSRRPKDIEHLLIYPRIDELPEDLLDILAYDFKVDWWDPEYSVEEKRRVLKSSWRVHKILGTKAAVVTAVRDIYPDSQLEEWFEYGGEPYHFRLTVDLTNSSGDRARRKRFLERVNFYKSLRSHNDGVRYFITQEKVWATAGGVLTGSREAVRREIPAPELTKPGARAEASAGGVLIGASQTVTVRPAMGPLTRPKGTARAVCGVGAAYSYQRQAVRIAI